MGEERPASSFSESDMNTFGNTVWLALASLPEAPLTGEPLSPVLIFRPKPFDWSDIM